MRPVRIRSTSAPTRSSNIYEDKNAYYLDEHWKSTPRPGYRNCLGHVERDARGHEPARARARDEDPLRPAVGHLGGGLLAGRRRRLPEADLGQAHRRRSTGRSRSTGARTTTSSHILQRDWEKGLGKKLAGQAPHLRRRHGQLLPEQRRLPRRGVPQEHDDPPYGGEVDYGDRAEHCWNGDPTRPNALSRLRYHQMFIPKAVERMVKTAPPGADVKSWRY